MDWIGGVRRRVASGKNNAVTQKQKAHFAKARAALQNTPSSKDLFRPAFYGKAASHRNRTASLQATPARKSGWSRLRGESDGPAAHHRQHNGAFTTAGSTDNRRRGMRGDGIHITSSSIRSSPGYESAGDAAVVAPIVRTHLSKPQDDTMPEEERLLVANRRRLLARTDWLGLSVTRPVHIKFRSNKDKDRIGRRRRIAKSTSQKGRPATRRLVTPLFEDRLVPGEYMMSGALQTKDVEVRIGTDAVASQAQYSHLSQTPRLATGRCPSTELGPLSEEPMLLGDEGDMFESLIPFARLCDRPEVESSLAPTNMAYEVATPTRETSKQEDGHELQISTNLVAEVAQVVSCKSAQGTNDEDNLLYKPASADFGSHDKHEEVISHIVPLRGQHQDAVVSQAHSTDGEYDSKLSNDRDVDDEAFWRRLMNFEEHAPNNPSLDAVKSSSLHVTNSDNSRRPILPVASDDLHDFYRILSTPKGAGTHTPLLQDEVPAVRSRESPIDNPSPSASLIQIRKLTELPSHAVAQAREDAGEDAAWRDFIIGSQDSLDVSLWQDHEGYPASREDIEADADIDVSLFGLSGLGTSVKSTEGGTQRVGRQSLYSQAQHPSRKTRDPPAWQQPLAPTKAAPTIDSDDIEDSRFEAPRRSRPVFPARFTILNPRRFK